MKPFLNDENAAKKPSDGKPPQALHPPSSEVRGSVAGDPEGEAEEEIGELS